MGTSTIKIEIKIEIMRDAVGWPGINVRHRPAGRVWNVAQASSLRTYALSHP